LTPDGQVAACLGDPALATFLRSAAKPFQILPLLLAGGEARFGLESADLALICASHAGTPAHTARAARLLEKGGFEAGDLLCGAHPPYDPESARRLEEAGEAPTPLHNNCSGKHAGMLLACRLLGFDPGRYTEPDHPLQRRILGELARACRLDAGEIALGTDGCSVPAFRLPLAAAARGYAALADPFAAGLDAERQRALARVAGAMTAAPEMVSGPGRFTTRLMEVGAGGVVAKEGAEGVFAVAVRGPAPLGIVVKIADGGERCRDGVVLEILRQLGALAEPALVELDAFSRPLVHNWRGIQVGEVVPEPELVRSDTAPSGEASGRGSLP
jgi:L-asparaginase II